MKRNPSNIQRGFTLISAGRLAILRRRNGRSSDINVQPQRGFTLIELLIAVAVLGIVVSIGTTAFNSFQARSNDTKRKSDLQKIKLALENYHNDNGFYPPVIPSPNPGQCAYESTGNSSAGCPTPSPATNWIPALSPEYLKIPPKDPKQAFLGGGFLAKIMDFFKRPLHTALAAGGGGGGGGGGTPFTPDGTSGQMRYQTSDGTYPPDPGGACLASTGNPQIVGQDKESSVYSAYRGYNVFDTSEINDASIVNSATLKMKLVSKTSAQPVQYYVTTRAWTIPHSCSQTNIWQVPLINSSELVSVFNSRDVPSAGNYFEVPIVPNIINKTGKTYLILMSNSEMDNRNSFAPEYMQVTDITLSVNSTAPTPTPTPSPPPPVVEDPGSVVSEHCFFGTTPWANPNLVGMNEGRYATVTLDGGQSSDCLTATNFGFNLPTNATITEIRVDVDRKVDTGKYGYDAVAQLITRGVPGEDKPNTSLFWPNSDGVGSYTFSTAGITPQDVNRSDFGFRLAAKNTAGVGTLKTFSVDHINIRVTFTTPLPTSLASPVVTPSLPPRPTSTALPTAPPTLSPGSPPPTGTFDLSFTYYYNVASNHQSYVLWASLQNSGDADIYHKSTARCRQIPPDNGTLPGPDGDFIYNYCAASEN